MKRTELRGGSAPSAIRWGPVAALAALAAGATVHALASPPQVIEIRVPEPTPPPPPPPPSGAVGPDGQPLPTAEARRPAYHPLREGVRREVRSIEEAVDPGRLFGRYHVVEVTEDGETEDFQIKMRREGKALDQDCITQRLVIDFGPPGGPELPAVLQVAEQRECRKGGLGVFASELALALPATWTRDGAKVHLSLPPVEATAQLVRVRKPSAGDLHTPSHWLGPESSVDRPRSEYDVRVELPEDRAKGKAKAKAGEEEPPALLTAVHLIEGGRVWHLEPEPLEGPFVR